jgi:lipoprotein signal peptidase
VTAYRDRLTAGFTAAGVFLLDQATKSAVRSAMSLGESRQLWGEVIRITYIMNPQGLMGMSFGPAGRHLLLPLSILAAGAILVLFLRWRKAGLLASAGLGMILAGAAGNILDRIRFGAVVDFIDCDIPDVSLPAFRLGFLIFPGFQLDRWYTFNVADSAVLAGVALLLALTLKAEGRRAGPTADGRA